MSNLLEPVAPLMSDLSALQLINLANTELTPLLEDILQVTDFEKKIVNIAQTIIQAVGESGDVALASILLNQLSCEYPVRHCVDTALVATMVAQRLKKPMETVLTIACAALTMNVGMHHEQKVFQSKSGPLNDAERAIIRNHPEEGARLLQKAGVLNTEWLSCVISHHENEDGSGYPDGIKTFEISQNAKIISIADRYCARVSARDYRKALQPDAAVRDMLMSDKKNINAILAACFTRELGIYPIGTYVKLKNGETALVTGRSQVAALPIVHSLRGSSGQILATPILRDTSNSEFALAHVLDHKDDAVKFNMQQLWGKAARI